MRVIIAGSRDGFVVEDVFKAIEKSKFNITEVVSGCARGVDKYGEEWAKINGVPIKKFPADWEKYGKSAGIIRNIDMSMYADALIAVWDGKSKGTNHMRQIMIEKIKPVYTYLK